MYMSNSLLNKLVDIYQTIAKQLGLVWNVLYSSLRLVNSYIVKVK